MATDIKKVVARAILLLRQRQFQLPPKTERAVQIYLAYAAGIDQCSFDGLSGREYRARIWTEVNKMIGSKKNPDKLIQRGFALGSKTVGEAHKQLEGDKSAAESIAKIVAEIRKSVSAAKSPFSKKIIAMYLQRYEGLELLNTFTGDGRGIGRAQAAFLISWEEVAGGSHTLREELEAQAILEQLRALARRAGERLYQLE